MKDKLQNLMARIMVDVFWTEQESGKLTDHYFLTLPWSFWLLLVGMVAYGMLKTATPFDRYFVMMMDVLTNGWASKGSFVFLEK